jgi:ketosteroid isomerase-like protein
MKRIPVAEEDRRSIADWFTRWGELVANVDFKRARDIYVEDVIAFGSLGKMLTTRDALEREQWCSVWPTVENYHYDLSTLEIVMSPDRLMAMGAAMFRSTGLHEDGSRFERSGRVTATLMRTAIDSNAWLATHTHVSLVPGTPARSHGNRPEAD